MLLQHTKYKGYSHHDSIKKNKLTEYIKIFENASLQSDEEESTIVRSKKKKKKIGCNNSEIENVCNEDVLSSDRKTVEPKHNKCPKQELGSDISVAITEYEVLIGRKSAKSKTKIVETCTQIETPEEEMIKNKKKKRKHTVKEGTQSKEG